RRPMRFGLHLRVCDLGLAVGNPCSAAIAVVDCDDFFDVMQLNRRAEIVPKCLVPLLERGRDHADRCTSNDELAELAGEVLLDRIFVHRLLDARIDAGQNHCFIVPLSRKRDVWKSQGRGADRDGPYKVPAIELAIQKTAATRAGSLTSNHLQCRHCPSLGVVSRTSNFAESCPFTLILHMCRCQKYATVSGDVRGIERSAIKFPRAPPPRGSGGESRQSATHDETARMIGRCLRGGGNPYS